MFGASFGGGFPNIFLEYRPCNLYVPLWSKDELEFKNDIFDSKRSETLLWQPTFGKNIDFVGDKGMFDGKQFQNTE